jgi:uncharacterized caspase-like protein
MKRFFIFSLCLALCAGAVQAQLSAVSSTPLELNFSTQNNVRVFTTQSDVDENIPFDAIKIKSYTFILIIGNENYEKFQTGRQGKRNVEFARRDAEVFAQYAHQTLCIPKENITLLTDATSAQFKREVKRLSDLAKKFKGRAELILYYAGHGMSHPKTRMPYLIPVDVTSSDVENGVRLAWVYQTLTRYPIWRATIFIDACFSGDGRGIDVITVHRKRAQFKAIPHRNLIVFFANADDQFSRSYHEKQHGLFTYHLLKKLQSSSGNVKYGELSQYFQTQVLLNVVRMRKEQDLNTFYSSDVANKWRNWTFK